MIRKWSIWVANLDPVKGSEQGKTRPVIIISDDSLNNILPVVNVLPFTSRKPGRKIYPNEVLVNDGKTGLVNESILLCYQIRTLDKSRLINELGIISDSKMQHEIISAIKFQLGID